MKDVYVRSKVWLLSAMLGVLLGGIAGGTAWPQNTQKFNADGPHVFKFSKGGVWEIIGYGDFCPEPVYAGCDNLLYEKYVGKMGQFVDFEKPIYNSFYFRQVVLETGEVYYLASSKLDDVYTAATGIKPLDVAEAEARAAQTELEGARKFVGRPIVPGSDVMVLEAFKDGAIRYRVSGDPKPIHEDDFKNIKKVLLSTDRRDSDAKLLVMLRSMAISEDRFEGGRFIEPIDAVLLYLKPKFSFAYVYIGQKRGRDFIRAKFHYEAGKWLFAERFVILGDDRRYDSPMLKFKRNNSAGEIWEVADIHVDAELASFLSHMVKADEVLIRYYGSQRTSDHKIDMRQRQMIAQVLELYALLGQL